MALPKSINFMMRHACGLVCLALSPEICARLHLEGLVAKRVDSRYEPGKRSSHWRKVKCAEWREHHAPLRHER